MISLNDRLRELRKKNNLTQSNVATLLGISEAAYGYYEQGRNEPSLNNIKKLANKYNVSISYLIGESDETTINQIDNSSFFDIEKWKKLNSQDIDELKNHFEWVVQKATRRNQEKNKTPKDDS